SNALVAAGGVTKVGSLRNVELRRGNELVETLDLYDILLHGNNGADKRLAEGDVIFVPVIGPVVGIAGDVKRPAIYDMSKKDPEQLREALQLAGGVSAFGYTMRLQVERVENHKKMVALDIDLLQASARRFSIRDGDVVKVFPVMPGLTNTVIVSGNIHRP